MHLRGKKICRNSSISHCFRDKGIIAFYAEIQDGRQKWPEKKFWENRQLTVKIPGEVKHFCRNLSHAVFRDKCFFEFYVEIQNGRQKWRGK